MTELHKRKLRVFLCHASNDKPAVRPLYQRLNAEGWIDPWLDEEKLLPGQDWDLEIENAVEDADAVLILLSNNSVTKEGYIQKELRFALSVALTKPEETIFIVPVRLEACQPPRRLRNWQYVDYFPSQRKDDAYQRLIESLKRRARSLSSVLSNVELSHRQALSLPSSAGATGRFTPDGHPIFTFGGIAFVRVPKGSFIMGSNDKIDRAKPQHEVNVPYDYLIGRYPVTNAEYGKFAAAVGISFGVKGKELHPLEGVNWNEANAFIRWLNQTCETPPQYSFSLSSEAEWEKAARGSDGRIWPWGDSFSGGGYHCNTKEEGKGQSTPVGAYSPHGDSPYGAADMSGNVWEWTRSLLKPYPYYPADGREIECASNTDTVALRGGIWDFGKEDARVAHRNGIIARFWHGVGFRVAIVPSSAFRGD